MFKLKQTLYWSTFFTFMLFQTPMTLAEDKNIEISGFARLVGGITSNDSPKLNGYDNHISFGEESLFATQINGWLTDKLSATGQLLYHTSDDRESGIEWAYLTYHHNHRLNFKLGKLRTPFFQYSDVIDVGYAYPWITPPKQVYQEYLFSSFEGVNVSYNFAGEQLAYYFEAYWGSFDDDVSVGGITSATEVDDLRGVLITIVNDNLSFRVSYHAGDVEIDDNQLNTLVTALEQFGFAKSAQSIKANGEVEFFQAGISYEGLDYFAQIELLEITSDLPAVTNTTGAYVTVGYNFHPFTAHVTVATSDSASPPAPVNEIPTGTPPLDLLADSYNSLFNLTRPSDRDSITLGLKWNLKKNIVLKTDVSWFDYEVFSSENPADTSSKNKQDYLMQVGLEWVY